MPKVFVSYRRQESQDVTGRICDRLQQALPKTDIFRDVDSIPMGQDFRKVLESAVAGCDVVLVVIGPAWTSAAVEGRRRLEDPNDYVRIEVETALRRGIPVVPLLVANAGMPKENELPETLREFVFRNARSVRPDPDFHGDMDRLVRELKTLSGAGGSSLPELPREERRVVLVALISAIVVGLALTSLYASQALRVMRQNCQSERHQTDPSDCYKTARIYEWIPLGTKDAVDLYETVCSRGVGPVKDQACSRKSELER
ncbi:MAG: toll/interleukin-1 receptor domain-containing protein [Elusimicrobia bacterium]|nr:toll/interleukin-1 receptor domain-containing protein [Elusimicrobiota bacterium]